MANLLTILMYYIISVILFTVFFTIELHKAGMKDYKVEMKESITSITIITTALIPFYRIYQLIEMCRVNEIYEEVTTRCAK